MKTKYILISLIILLAFGCTPSFDGLRDESSSNSDKTYFSPPNWIQGVWAETGIIHKGFKFTKNDFIIQYNYTTYIGTSLNDRINILGTKSLRATEQISSTEYHITIFRIISLSTTNTTDYNFTKVSDNEINCHYKQILWGEETIGDYSLTRRMGR